MSRKRYQRGQVFLRGSKPQKWIGRYRDDVRQGDEVRRLHRSVVLGTLREYPTKRLAQRQLDRLLNTVNGPDYRPTTIMRYSVFAEQWMERVLPMHKPSSRNSEQVHMKKHILPFFGGMNLADIRVQTVQQFIASLKRNPKTVRNIYATFRVAWKKANEWGYVIRDLRGLVMPRLLPVERPAFTMEQMKQIISAADEPFKTFFWLAAETGMRAGELCGLRWEDINDGKLQVRQSIWRGTTGSPKSLAGTRTMPLSTNLSVYLEGQRSSMASGLLFRTNNGRPWDTRFIVRDKLHPLLERIGIPRVGGTGLHAFRHGNATHRLQQGEDVKTLAARLGHSDASITLRVYAHAAPGGGRELSDAMGAALSTNTVPKLDPPETQLVAA